MRDEGGRMIATGPDVPSSSFILPPSSIRVLLWDIDGTLIRSAHADAYKEYFIPTVEHVFGTAGQLERMRVSGMTDLQIVAQALQDEGFTHQHVTERVDQFREDYMVERRRVTRNGVGFFEVIPGFPEGLPLL